MENLQEVYAALARIPRLSRVAADQVRIERLAGLTNRNYEVSTGDDRFVLRIPDGLAEGQKEAERVRAALNERPAALRPCHCDPLAENFLDTGTRIFIIDWEYAGNNDPMWDLGDVSVEAGFGPDQDAALLQT